jgi:hypothetical protein
VFGHRPVVRGIDGQRDHAKKGAFPLIGAPISFQGATPVAS